MLTPLQKFAFKLLSIEFFFFPALPITWNAKYTHLITQQRRFTLSKISLAFTTTCIFFTFTGMCFVILTHLVIHPRPEFNIGMLTMYITGSIAAGSGFVFIWIIYKNQDALCAVSNLLSYKHLLFHRFHATETEPLFDFMLIFLAMYAIIGATGTFFGSLYLKFDPYYYIFNDILVSLYPTKSPSDVLGESKVLRWTLLGIRATLTLTAFEAARILVTYGLVVAIDMRSLQGCAQFLSTLVDRVECIVVMKEYRKMIVVFRSLKGLIDDATSMFITALFWAIGGCSFLIIKGFGKIPHVMYHVMVLFVVVASIIIMVVLHIICDLVSGTETIVGWCNLETDITRHGMPSAEKRRNDLALKLEAKSMHPIRMQYKPFLMINRDFMRAIISAVLGRIFDAILLF
ncbi:unnamed protein product [Orchesella dallaii]|uniref:Gustatory receptor n=1 Tax=Orchesella dallaii TaxID=48710 RepID=A0ABP1QCV8_9HEXA